MDIAFSGISTGTERLLWQGRMPPFPGMGYPLVPGYEFGRPIVAAGPDCAGRIGETVFVPGATCFGEIRGLFGGAASRLVVPAARALTIDPALGERGMLMALAATAQHAIAGGELPGPDRRPWRASAGCWRGWSWLRAAPPPVVWETNPQRMDGAAGYQVVHPDADPRRDYRCICDASGDSGLLDTLIGRIAPGGEIVLAGFYADRLSFALPDGLHAGSAVAGRRAMAAGRPGDRRGA